MQSMMVSICAHGATFHSAPFEMDHLIGGRDRGRHLSMFQMFHEVVVHQGPLDQLAGPTITEDGQQSVCFVCVCVCVFARGILCSLFALEIAGKCDISELGRVQSGGLG